MECSRRVRTILFGRVYSSSSLLRTLASTYLPLQFEPLILPQIRLEPSLLDSTARYLDTYTSQDVDYAIVHRQLALEEQNGHSLGEVLVRKGARDR